MKFTFLNLLNFTFIILLLITCEEKSTSLPSQEIKRGSLIVGEDQYQLVPLGQYYSVVFDCIKFNNSGDTINSKVSGINLILIAESINNSKPMLALSLGLNGHKIGKYFTNGSLCDSKSIQSTSSIDIINSSKSEKILNDSYVEISDTTNGLLSGKFNIKIKYNSDFLSDSLIYGEFYNIPSN